jgi:HEAT repeat protein
MRLQIYLLTELAPHLSGAEQQALRRLAQRSGLLATADRLCRSWFWPRRLFGARLCTLLAHASPALRQRLLADRTASVRAQAIEWAVHAPDAAAIAALLAMLTDRDGRCRFAAQDTLVRIGQGALDPLLAHLATAADDAVLGALEVALTLADARLLGPGLALAVSPSPAVRARAVGLLGALGSPPGLSALAAALDDADAAVRLAALRALGALGHWPAAPAVATRLHDEAWDVRRQAALTLRALGAPGLILLRRCRDVEDPLAAAVARYALDLAEAGVSS